MTTQIRPSRPSRFSAFKTIILCLLAGVTCMSFVGCGGDTESSTSPVDEITSSTSDGVVESSDGSALLLTSSSESESSSSEKAIDVSSSSGEKSSSSSGKVESSSSDKGEMSSSSKKVLSSSSAKTEVSSSSTKIEASSSSVKTEESSSSKMTDESSSSGGGTTQPCSDASCTNLQVSNASQCDLATQRLPASSLAWQPTFSGGCEVSQQIPLDELLKFDTLLIAAGYEKEELVQESYRYARKKQDSNSSVAFNDTLLFTYKMGTFVGNFYSKKDLMSYYVTLACPILIPSSLFEDHDVCKEVNEKGYVYAKSFDVFTTTSRSLRMNLEKDGWKCSAKNSGGVRENVSCSVVYENQSYSFSYQFNYDSEEYNISGIVFKWVAQQ